MRLPKTIAQVVINGGAKLIATYHYPPGVPALQIALKELDVEPFPGATAACRDYIMSDAVASISDLTIRPDDGAKIITFELAETSGNASKEEA